MYKLQIVKKTWLFIIGCSILAAIPHLQTAAKTAIQKNKTENKNKAENKTKKTTQPYILSADSIQYNKQRQQVEYIGHAQLIQNKDNGQLDTKVTGQRISLIKQANHWLIQADGNPATYQTHPNKKPVLYGKAKRINYKPSAKMVDFIGQAWIKQGRTTFTATRIHYNMRTAIVTTPRANKKWPTKIVLITTKK